MIEDVEDRINGFAAEVRFAQPFRTRNAELDKLANRQNREIAMAAIAPPIGATNGGDVPVDVEKLEAALLAPSR